MTEMMPIDSELRPEERAEFEAIAESLGMSSATAIRVFVRRFNAVGGFPFAMRAPHDLAVDDDELSYAESREAHDLDKLLAERVRNRNNRSYVSIEEARRELLGKVSA